MRMWQATGFTSQPPGMRATRCCSISRRVHAHAATASPNYCSVAAATDVSLIQAPNHPLAMCSLLLLDVLASEYALGRPVCGLTQGLSACSVRTRSIQGVVGSTAPGLGNHVSQWSLRS